MKTWATLPLATKVKIVVAIVVVSAWRIANVLARLPFGPACAGAYARRMAERDKRETEAAEQRIAELHRQIEATNAATARLNEQSRELEAQNSRLRCEIADLRAAAREQVQRN